MPLLYTIGKLTVGNSAKWGWRPTVEGIENIPETGGAILAGNHLSAADQIFLGAIVPRHIAFWAKSEYFTGTGPKGAVIAGIFRGLGAIPVNREGGRAALTALDAAIPALQGGDLVGIFPEGTRSVDGRLYRGRTGVARLALLAGVPVVPMGFLGTDKVQPIGQRLPRLGPKVTIKVGKPLDFTGRTNDRATMREITDQIMSEIQALTGQEYVGRYAGKRVDPD